MNRTTLLAATLALGRLDRAELLFKQALILSPPPRVEAGAAYHLSRILEGRGLRAEGERYRIQAMMLLRSDPSIRAEFEAYSRPK